MIDKGYPIARDTSLKGYYYTQSFTPMLAQVITESELTRLFFAVRAVEALQESPVFRSCSGRSPEALSAPSTIDLASTTSRSPPASPSEHRH
jgi:hypothetical protein